MSFAKNAFSQSVFELETSSKVQIMAISMRTKIWEKNVFQKCNHGYKNVACLYLSNGAR